MPTPARILKPLIFSGIFGLLQAQAIPVLFQGHIDIESTPDLYYIEFGVSDLVNPEGTFYSLFWDSLALSDSSLNFSSVTSTGGTGWNFSFTHEVLGETFDLLFSQATEKVPAAVSFQLRTPDPTVLITPDPDIPTRLTVTGLNPNRSYLADIAATDPFVGTLAINPASSGAPEIDPRSSSLPALFLFGVVFATRRQPAQKRLPEPDRGWHDDAAKTKNSLSPSAERNGVKDHDERTLNRQGLAG